MSLVVRLIQAILLVIGSAQTFAQAPAVPPKTVNLWPGPALGSERWTQPETVIGSDGNHRVMNVSTPNLMQEFYRLRESSARITKLEALRETQLALLRGDLKSNPIPRRDRGIVTNHPLSDVPSFPRKANAPYAHPYYWAPFFLMRELALKPYSISVINGSLQERRH